jgi:hypothetical protein
LLPSRLALAAIESLLGEPIVRVEPLLGGGNSRALRIATPTRVCVAKCYADGNAEGNSRLQAEYRALGFLWDRGLRCIPQPLGADEAGQVALFEFVAGGVVASGEVDAAMIDQMTSFLIRLRRMAQAPGASQLPAAAEARFSLRAVVDNIQVRLGRLLDAATTTPLHGDMKDFLRHQLVPALAQKSALAARRLGSDYTAELLLAARTLSPSDFGIHNLLRRPDGELCFLDFEYFGWDDPAKLVADVLWHPRNAFDIALKQRFARTMSRSFADIPGFAARLALAYPLFGLKWCLILLNEFVPRDLRRRQFAQGAAASIEAILASQLAKAEYTLGQVLADDYPFALSDTP